nr:16S rRNA (cytosine(1402)-N(4))-methyltransferase RsmH [Pseudomonadota bacterium]
GGHTRALLDAGASRVIGLDRDRTALALAAETLHDHRERVEFVHTDFRALPDVLDARGLTLVDGGILADLGVSSMQLDDASRGFSFKADAPLDMRMDPEHGASAAQWLATAEESEIREVIRDYGEERFAKQIAAAIVAARASEPVVRTRQLADLVAKAVRTREPGQDPATRTFQALRIHVNRELEEVSLMLPQAVAGLAPGGRLAVISFHSLEDRIVKRFIGDRSSSPAGSRYLPEAQVKAATFDKRGGAISPTPDEIEANPRARSAKLRVAIRTAAPFRAADPSIFGLPKLPEIRLPVER